MCCSTRARTSTRATLTIARRRRSGCSSGGEAPAATSSRGTSPSVAPRQTFSWRRRSASPTGRARCSQADPSLLDLRTGRGEYGEKPPSSYHIYFWTIGDGLTALDVAAQFDQRETLDAMMAFASVPQRLLSACRQGDEALARNIVREHPGIVASLAPDEHRAIADAAWNGDARAVALMLEWASTRSAGTGLGHTAALRGVGRIAGDGRGVLRHPDARTLVAIRDAHHGATPLGWCCHGRCTETASHHAEVARLLLAAGARPGDDTGDSSPAVPGSDWLS